MYPQRPTVKRKGQNTVGRLGAWSLGEVTVTIGRSIQDFASGDIEFCKNFAVNLEYKTT